ncbi:MAG: DUF342 domain-containing protein [Spirochaetes bacterium]|nr:DUF342 domain-containing protein [Spirochaetota bacterium]
MPYYSFEQTIPVSKLYKAITGDTLSTVDVMRMIHTMSANFVRPGDVIMKFDNSRNPPATGKFVEVNIDARIIKATEFGYVSYTTNDAEIVEVFPFFNITPDKVKASMVMPDLNVIKRPFSISDILSEIERRSFRLDYNKEAIRAGFEAGKKGEGSVFVFAAGNAAIHTRPTEIKTSPSLRPLTRHVLGGNEKILTFDFAALPFVKAGSQIANVIQPKPGINGEDAYGEIIPCKGGKEPHLVPDKNIQLSPDQQSLVATEDGMLVINDRAVMVVKVRETAALADAAEEAVEEALVVRGNIERSRISCKGPIIVFGDVIASSVKSETGIFVKGVIRGANGMKIISSGDVFANEIIGAAVAAGGFIGAKTIHHSAIKTNAGVIADPENGIITASRIDALLGVSAGTIGDGSSESVLRVGCDDEMKAKLVGYNQKEEDNQLVIKKFIAKLGPNFLKDPRAYMKNIAPDQINTVKVLIREYNNICYEQKLIRGWITRLSVYLAQIRNAKVKARIIAAPASITIRGAAYELTGRRENIELAVNGTGAVKEQPLGQLSNVFA